MAGGIRSSTTSVHTATVAAAWAISGIVMAVRRWEGWATSIGLGWERPGGGGELRNRFVLEFLRLEDSKGDVRWETVSIADELRWTPLLHLRDGLGYPEMRIFSGT